ncbi:MAG TPA: hypothetical protein VMS18_07405 [Candidatus Binatia bacterium]|nr:hypothetical protein [Candidatus Binatia bacterium]
MRRLSVVFLISLASVAAFCQTDSAKYQPGTILAVERHQEASSESSSTAVRYDVSVQIEDTVFVVLYTPPYGSNTVEYSPGIERLFNVRSDSLRYQEHGGYADLPILRTSKLPPQPAIDWSKAPSQYYSMKMKNLTSNLNLSEEQQGKIKPIAEQESAEAGSVIFTSVVSRKDRLREWEKIVRKSDAKMKPILTEAQWQKLQEMRKDQKRDFSELITKRDAETAK